MAGEGIIFTTRGWTGAQLLVTHVTDGSDIYVVDGDVHNAMDVANDLRVWLEDDARPWMGSVDDVIMNVEDDEAGRLAFKFTANDPFDLSGGTAAWRSRICVQVGNDRFGTTRGSCSASPGTTMWERWDTTIGARARAHSWRTGHPTLSHRRPTCELGLDLSQMWALDEALRLATAPRTAWVFDELGDTWRYVTVGACAFAPQRDDDTTTYTATLDLLGGP